MLSSWMWTCVWWTLLHFCSLANREYFVPQCAWDMHYLSFGDFFPHFSQFRIFSKTSLFGFPFPSFPSHSYCWFEFLFRENFLVFITWSSPEHHKLTTTITTISSSLGSVEEYQHHHHPHPHHPFMDVSTTHSPGGYLLATEWSWDFRNSAACIIHWKKM